MVDFQERDTSRGLGDDAGDEPDGEGGHGGHDHEGESHDHGHGGEHAHDGHQGHQGHHAHDAGMVGAAVVTVSSTRTIEDDPSGDAIIGAFEAEGHRVPTRELVADEYDRIQQIVSALADRDDVDLVVTTGGTGITPDDVTPDAVRPLFEKRLPGFGELFRRRSEADIGTRAIATRATAGVIDGTPVFCLPGSEGAVELGVGEIILPTAGHLVGLAGRGEGDGEGATDA